MNNFREMHRNGSRIFFRKNSNSKFQVPCPIRAWLALEIAHRRTCSMFQIFLLDQCYPMETEALKFSIASWKNFPYRSSKFHLSHLMSSQKTSNIENI